MRFNTGYYGKQSDCAAAVLQMAMSVHGKYLPHADCLTTRPFGLKCPMRTPRLWLSPFISPWDGIITALKTSDLFSGCRMLDASDNCKTDDLIDNIEYWLKDGPVIAGPLERGIIWGRIESLFYQGASHFVFVINKEDDHFTVHDPEGCPYFQIKRERLQSAIENSPFKNGIIQIKSVTGLPPTDEILLEAFFQCLENHAAACDSHDGCSNGLKMMSERVVSARLKSSEAGSLHFGLPALVLNLNHIMDFLTDLPEIMKDCFDLKPDLTEIMNIYNE